MSFPSPLAKGKLVLLLGFVVALAACSNNGTAPAYSAPAVPVNLPSTTYSYETTIALPGVPPTGKTFGFDIGFVDETVHQYYLADKITNGVDVVATLTPPYGQYLGTAGAGAFQGSGATVAGFPRSPNGGPNGVVPIANGLVAAGDGNSTLKIVNAGSLGGIAMPPASIAVPNPYVGPALGPGICAGPAAATGTPTVGAGNFRVDEMAYDPVDNQIIAVSDNACPVFITIFQATAPYSILKQFALLTANGGGEQPLYDPTQGKFFVAIPSTTTNPNGAIEVVDPKAFTITEVGIPVACGPSGFALGPNEVAMLGCSGSLTFINLTNFKVVNQLMGPAPDEVWYAPGTNRFYAADTGNAKLVVTDVNGNLIANVPTSAGAHSVAVEGANDHVFVPQTAGSAIGLTVYNH